MSGRVLPGWPALAGAAALIYLPELAIEGLYRLTNAVRRVDDAQAELPHDDTADVMSRSPGATA